MGSCPSSRSRLDGTGTERFRSPYLLDMNDAEASDFSLIRLLTIEQLSEYLDVPVPTLYDWRVDGKGPRAVRVGRRLRYTIPDVHAWLDSQREPPTASAR